jgi:hypothetical protein
MWEIEYKDEVKFYFLDNYPYTFDLLIRIEELRYYPDAIPPEGCTPVDPDLYLWEVEGHLVYYGIHAQKIVVVVVKPVV